MVIRSQSQLASPQRYARLGQSCHDHARSRQQANGLSGSRAQRLICYSHQPKQQPSTFEQSDKPAVKQVPPATWHEQLCQLFWLECLGRMLYGTSPVLANWLAYWRASAEEKALLGSCQATATLLHWSTLVRQRLGMEATASQQEDASGKLADRAEQQDTEAP